MRPGSGRDLRIDLLRGLAVLAMMVDHVAGASPLRWLTGGNQFYTSAAEGFVLLAGLSAGLVTARSVQRGTMRQTSWRFVHRAALLYVLVCVISLAFNIGQPLARLLEVVTLKQPYPLMDVLVLYAMLFALAPVAAHLLAHGRTLILLLVSVAVWGAYQLAPQLFNVLFLVGRDDHFLFPLPAWQVLFCSAMAAGYHRDWISRRLTRAVRTRTLVLAGVVATVLFLVYNHVGGLTLDPATAGRLFAKETVGVGRLVASASIFPLLYALATVLGPRTCASLGWVLIPLGRRSLLAFVLHLVALICIIHSGPALTPFTSAAMQALTVGFVWASVSLFLHLAALPRRARASSRRLALMVQITATLIRG